MCIVNDATRPTPIVIATEAHKTPTEHDTNVILGAIGAPGCRRTLVHDAKKSECVCLGTTCFGTQVHFNFTVVEAINLCAIISVESVYFVG